MKAILTKTLYATNTKPTRIKVQAEGVPHVVVSRSQFEGSEEEIHRAAALKLCEKYSWGVNLVSGGLPTPGQWVHCFVPEATKPANTFEVTVAGCTREQAEQVLRERLGHDEDYGFDYSLNW